MRYYEKYWENPREAPPSKDATTPERVRLLISAIGGRKKVLDIGCGDGLITAQIAAAGKDAMGMDVSRRAIAAARKKHGGVRFVEGSAEGRYPFASGSFDAVFAGDVIEHVYDTPAMLSEVNRVLKAGGLFIATMPYHGLLKNMATVLFRFDEHFDPAGPHVRFFTARSLRKLLEKHGFGIDRVRYVGRHRPFSKGMFVVARKLA